MSKRSAIQYIVEEEIGNKAQASRALGLARSAIYRRGKQNEEKEQIKQQIKQLSENHPRYGYRRITALMRGAGKRVNAKRVQRIRRQEGYQVSKRQRKMRRKGKSTALRQRAQRRNHVWSWDFVYEQTENGRVLRILTLIDEYTRESLATHVAWNIKAVDVIKVIEKTMKEHGIPEHIRSDNGPEFIAQILQDWLSKNNIKTLYITPGCPWENGHIESFHDKFRDECLNRELFGSLTEAKVLVEEWRKEYNEQRPHSSLGYKTPQEFGQDCNLTSLRPTACASSDCTNNVNQRLLLYF